MSRDTPGEAGIPEGLCYSLVVPREEIFYISWTLDAYEGLGFLRTDDASRGLVSILCPAEAAAQIEEILTAFGDEGIVIQRNHEPL